MISKIRPKNFNPKFEANGVYLILDGKILVLKRSEDEETFGKWCMPGGTLDKDEDPKEALVREVKEEIGVTIDKKKIGNIAVVFVSNPKLSFLYHMFKYELDRLPKIALNDEHSEYRWVTPQEALKLDLIEDEDECLKLAFNISP
jgi:8-oxo-dGTP pyrophosphatase MutT (NUDIX family)